MVRSRGLSPRSAALACGIPARSFYAMVDGDESFRSDLEVAAAKFEAALVGSILKDAFALKSWRAKVALLQAVAPRWIPATKLDMTVEQHDPVADMTDEEIDERLAQLRGMQREPA